MVCMGQYQNYDYYLTEKGLALLEHDTPQLLDASL